MSDLYSADDDHPLKSTDISFSNLSIAEINADKINSELQSVAVDWKPLRSTTVCACSTPFDQIVRKVKIEAVDSANTRCRGNFCENLFAESLLEVR